jgi:hypothetical protein
MPFSQEVTLCGLLPVSQLCRRYKAGEIASAPFVRALLGSLAQDQADELDDGDPVRDDLLDYVGETEDWFQQQFLSDCRQ